MRSLAPVLLCAAACAAPGGDTSDTTAQELPCAQIASPHLDVVPADVAWGDFVDGDEVLYGDPPQGGPPYAPFKVRIDGLARLDEGATVSLAATDAADSAALGAAEYQLGFICANVGDNAGMWMAPDVHLRFDGWTLDDLAGKTAQIDVDVTDLDGATVHAALSGPLVRMP